MPFQVKPVDDRKQSATLGLVIANVVLALIILALVAYPYYAPLLP